MLRTQRQLWFLISFDFGCLPKIRFAVFFVCVCVSVRLFLARKQCRNAVQCHNGVLITFDSNRLTQQQLRGHRRMWSESRHQSLGTGCVRTERLRRHRLRRIPGPQICGQLHSILADRQIFGVGWLTARHDCERVRLEDEPEDRFEQGQRQSGSGLFQSGWQLFRDSWQSTRKVLVLGGQSKGRCTE